GFSDEGLIKAGEPFFRDEKDSQTHFGLGLYISRILCEKCGGTMSIRNNEKVGATVEIIFQK
ncbi:MAG: ATP-binding protein, partial [Oscillospiraceae bacterium]|nr:ATP-binding protein [Oscillospiraceae bacterium]